MLEDTKQLIARIGETDQLFLSCSTPELALERGQLRMELVNRSNHRQEQVHFLQEAIVILEQGRLEYEEMPLRVYLDLSIQLAKAYMVFFVLNREAHFALIAQQILKPLAHYEHGEIFLILGYASVAKNELALTRHWLSKYTKTQEFDRETLRQHFAFQAVRNEDWFMKLLQSRVH